MVNVLDGYTQIRAFKITTKADAKKFNEMQEGGNINDFIQMALFKANEKIGDVTFESTVSEDGGYTAYVNYSDGSKEKLEDIFAPGYQGVGEIPGRVWPCLIYKIIS